MNIFINTIKLNKLKTINFFSKKQIHNLEFKNDICLLYKANKVNKF